MDVATAALTDRVEELRADHGHGASWMARRAVEALAAVAEEPASSAEGLVHDLTAAGRQLADSRPGVGAVAGAVGRVLAAAAGNARWRRHLERDPELAGDDLHVLAWR